MSLFIFKYATTNLHIMKETLRSCETNVLGEMEFGGTATN